MRRIAVLCLGVSVIALQAACGRPEINTVRVTFSCDNDGGRIGVAPWRLHVDTSVKTVTWTIPEANVTVFIEPKDTSAAKWPFVSQKPITVKSGEPGRSPEIKMHRERQDTIYKYKVTGVCARGSNQDTVVLDPDMIIPD